jgi:hypothetical protein
MKKTRLLEIIREEIVSVLTEKTALGPGATSDPDFQKAFNKLPGDEKEKVKKGLQTGSETFVFEKGELEEDQLNEMAKISGRLETAIKKVISDNPDLDGLPLKKKIRADEEVEDALEGDTLYDNQLNKFIALVKGERTLGQRGRKPGEKSEEKPEKSKETPTSKAASPTTKKEPEIKSSKLADDKDSLLNAKAEVEAKMKELAQKRKTAPEKDQKKLLDDLKALNVKRGEIEKKIAKL